MYRGRDPRLGRDVAVKVLTGDVRVAECCSGARFGFKKTEHDPEADDFGAG